MILPSSAFAKIADGTYELNYEMKEAYSENTSIADGYFTKPAILTVENGVQYIQITLTGSNYIESLTAPSGPVEIISEDTTNFIRVVKFRVDGDLSQPLEMEMHIVVPDLYDMTHTARALFDVSGLKTESNNEQSVAPPATSGNNTTQSENNVENHAESTENEEQSNKEEPQEAVENEETEDDNESEVTSNEDSNNEADEEANSAEVIEEVEEETALEEVSDETEETQEQDTNSSSALWITIVVILIIVAGLLFWKLKINKKQ